MFYELPRFTQNFLIKFFSFNKSTELLFVQLRLFDDWKEEFRSWANKSRSLAIGAGFAAMSNPAKINKEKLFINNKFLKTKKPVSQIFLTIYETDFSIIILI